MGTGVTVGAGVGVATGVGTGVTVGAGVGVAVGVGTGVTVGVGAGVAVGVGTGVAVWVTVGVATAGVGVGVGVGLTEGAAAGVAAGVAVGVAEGVAVGVTVGVSELPRMRPLGSNRALPPGNREVMAGKAPDAENTGREEVPEGAVAGAAESVEKGFAEGVGVGVGVAEEGVTEGAAEGVVAEGVEEEGVDEPPSRKLLMPSGNKDAVVERRVAVNNARVLADRAVLSTAEFRREEEGAAVVSLGVGADRSAVVVVAGAVAAGITVVGVAVTCREGRLVVEAVEGPPEVEAEAGTKPSGMTKGRTATVAVGVVAYTAESPDSGFWVRAGTEAGMGTSAEVAEGAAVWRVKRGRRAA